MNNKIRINQFIAGICLGVSITYIVKEVCLQIGYPSSPIQLVILLALCALVSSWFYKIYPNKLPKDELEFKVEYEVSVRMKTELYGFIFFIAVILQVLIYKFPEAYTALRLERLAFFSGVLLLQIHEQFLKKSKMKSYADMPFGEEE